MAGRKGAVRRRETLCVVQLAVFVHCAGAVGIEFTERIAAGGFIVKKVDTGHRDKARAAAGVEDEVLRPGVKAEEGAVAGVGKIGVDHLFKNAVQDLHIGRQAVKIGRRQQLGGKAGAHILAVVDCGRSFHIGDNRVKIPAQRGGVRLGQGAVFGREGRHGGFHRAHTSRSVFFARGQLGQGFKPAARIGSGKPALCLGHQPGHLLRHRAAVNFGLVPVAAHAEFGRFDRFNRCAGVMAQDSFCRGGA